MTSLTLVRRIAARPSVVFAALTTPASVSAWWPPEDLPATIVEIDARVGGTFRIRFPTSDGSEQEACGEYLELTPPSRLVMTWRWVHGGVALEHDSVSRIEMVLRPIDGGVELTVTHADLRNERSAVIHEEGWTASLAKLDRLLAALP